MDKEILTFSNVEIEKRKFQYSKYPVDIKNVGTNKIMKSKTTFLIQNESLL